MSDPDPVAPEASAPAPVTGPAGTGLTSGIRRLPVWAFVLIAVIYLVIVQGLGKLLTSGLDTGYAAPTSINELWRGITVPVFVSLVFVYAVVAVLGWRRPVLTDRKPVRPWVWILPVIMIITVLAGVNYAGLGHRGAGFTALLAVTMLGVGFAEEGMFRGLGVVTFRANGFSEVRVALWTCVLFGLAHATNLVSEGPKALLQVLVTAVAGYFFYLIRRVSGGLVVPAVVHGLWDFGLISASVLANKLYGGAGLFIVADVILALIVLIRQHHIEPTRSAANG
jgi:membrane protease YdiL (CAAX protease family)